MDKVKELIEDFKKDEVYVNSNNNYFKLYSEMANQRNEIDRDFKPKIEKNNQLFIELKTRTEK